MVQYRNFVSSMGRLTADPELRQAGETKVLNFTVAVRRIPSKDSTHPTADFIDCVAWGKTAENITKYFKKGDRIGVAGSLQSRNYEDKNGVKRKATEVIVDMFEIIEPKTISENEEESDDSADSEETPY